MHGEHAQHVGNEAEVHSPRRVDQFGAHVAKPERANSARGIPAVEQIYGEPVAFFGSQAGDHCGWRPDPREDCSPDDRDLLKIMSTCSNIF